MTRGAIPIKSLEAAFMLPDSIGYIKLSQFAITSHNELITALNNLKAQGMKRLIFDLRGNPGGFSTRQSASPTNSCRPTS